MSSRVGASSGGSGGGSGSGSSSSGGVAGHGRSVKGLLGQLGNNGGGGSSAHTLRGYFWCVLITLALVSILCAWHFVYTSGPHLPPNLAQLHEGYDSSLCRDYPAACTCPVANNASVVIFNRIPKAGSQSTLYWLRGHFTSAVEYCRTGNYLERRIETKRLPRYQADPVKYICGKTMKPGKVYVAQKHTFFAPKTRADTTYFNVLREPISRCESRFYYEQTKQRIPAMSFADCISKRYCLLDNLNSAGDIVPSIEAKRKQFEAMEGWTKTQRMRMLLVAEECSSNYQTRWMCGSLDKCEQGSFDDLLAEAKRVMLEEHLVVGTTARIPETLWMLNIMLPKYLGKTRSFNQYEDLSCAHCPGALEAVQLAVFGRSAESSRPQLPDDLMDQLKQANALDTELFIFADAVMSVKAVHCVSHLANAAGATGGMPGAMPLQNVPPHLRRYLLASGGTTATYATTTAVATTEDAQRAEWMARWKNRALRRRRGP